ncbi:MAG TPA: hypothetical protein VK886_08570 [Vicinamibacterales bacterium]|nr:hypothetical protein [Vicinamibacterales bacterium]
MSRASILVSTVVLFGAAACTGSGGERQLPASPTSLGDTNSANITAPTPESPTNDQMLDTIRPTLRVANATSSGSGARTYEFQISDSEGFAQAPGAPVAPQPLTIALSGIAEGSDGKTSFSPQADLLPVTRYYWRARALQGSSVGPWSTTARFRTKVESFKSGNRVFDILTNGMSVADENSNVSLIAEGGKLNAENAYLMYRLSSLQEGEISFIGWRVKPDKGGKILTMQDGTGDFDSNPHRVRVEKRTNRDGGNITFQFGGNTVESGGVGWVDNTDYYFKVEWRGGTARLRVYEGFNDLGSPFLELSTSYTAPYGAAAPSVIIGSRNGDTCADIRVSRLHVGPAARLIPIGSR